MNLQRFLTLILFIAGLISATDVYAQNPSSAAKAEVEAEKTETKAKPKPHLLYDAASDLKRLRGGEIKAPPETANDDDEDVKPEDLLRDDHINPPSAAAPAPEAAKIEAETPDLDDYLLYDLLGTKAQKSPATNN